MNATNEGSVQRPAWNGERPGHELEVLEDEEERAEQDEDPERVDGERGAEGAHAEEPQVDQRVGEPASAGARRRARSRARPRWTAIGGRPEAVLGDLLEPVDDRQHGDERERGARPGRAGRRRDRGTRAGAAARARAAAPSPARPAGRPSPTRRTRAATPPSSGPIAPPSEYAVIQTPIANVRWLGSWNMFRISDSVDGAIVAPAMPEERAGGDQHLGARRERAEQRREAEGDGADQQQAPAADPVAERAHRDQRAGDHEAVDVDDPEQLGAGRLQVLAQGRHREVQHGQVHRVDDAGEREHARARPIRGVRPAR